MNEEEAIDILKNCIADYVIGEYCSKCEDSQICESKNEDCYYLQSIDAVLNLLEKKDKIIDLMAEQLAGLAIFDIDKDEPLILGDKEEVKQYFKEKVEG